MDKDKHIPGVLPMPELNELEKVLKQYADEVAPKLAEPAKKKKGGVVLDREIQEALNADPLKKTEVIAAFDEPFRVIRLAFQSDPTLNNNYLSLYKQKVSGLPYEFQKKIGLTDSLVASIWQLRQNHLSPFGRPRQNRADIGFTFKLKNEYIKFVEKQPEEIRNEIKENIQSRVEKVSKLLLTCGHTSGLEPDEYMTFSQYLSQSVRNALGMGKIATEIIKVPSPTFEDPKREVFHSFRPIDAGTIYRCTDYTSAAKDVRRQALQQLAQIKNAKLDPRLYVQGKYTWVQVINGIPRQAFTAQECVVYNFYQIPDIETDGYPITPMETVFSDILTHINITNHNKLYFQSGRAARGIVVIKSDDVDDRTVSALRAQMNASINGVQNSWRLPVFAIAQDDNIQWQQIDPTNRDMEFQYLTDMNSRTIMAAYQISPDEIPGYAHLSRGTNNQTLSESSNEFKLEAHRDVGIRPLIRQFEDFLNSCIIPVMDKELSEICILELSGLEAESAEKEAQRLQTDSQLWETQNGILQRVERKPLPKFLGGDYPLSPAFQKVLDAFVPVGVTLEHIFGIEGASKDPQWQYLRDTYWFNKQQMIMQEKLQQQQMQMAQQAQAQPDGHNTPPEVTSAVEEAQPVSSYEEETEPDLGQHLDVAIDSLSKSNKHMSAESKRILEHHQDVIKHVMDGWSKDVDEATAQMMHVIEKLKNQ